MSTKIRRASQAMVKMMADQVGVQANSEQLGNEWGRLINATTETGISQAKTKQEDLGATSYIIDRNSPIYSESHFNMGFQEKKYE